MLRTHPPCQVQVLQELQPTRSLDKLRNAWPFTQLLGTAPLFEFPEASHRDSLFKHISSRLSQRLFYSHPGALPRSFSRIFRTLTFKRLEEEEACCSGENSFRSPTQSYGTPERPIRHPPVADSNRSANDSQPAAAVVGGLARDRLPRPGFMRCRLTARLAPEPSDIVWRSLAWTTSERAARTLCGWLIMLAAILISGWATVAITEAWGKPPPAPAFTHSYQVSEDSCGNAPSRYPQSCNVSLVDCLTRRSCLRARRATSASCLLRNLAQFTKLSNLAQFTKHYPNRSCE